MKNVLVIGNKNYSSWSLRPWLLLKEMGIEFDEVRISLYQPDSKDKLLQYAPTGLVPYFSDQEVEVWDSLAICDYIADRYPELPCWPCDRKQRALARSVAAEMHSGFTHLRNLLPMNCRKNMRLTPVPAELQVDIDRICAIWRGCREQASAGDFLFGAFSIADAMYAPVVLRFHSYGIAVDEECRAYMETILAMPHLQDWIADGIAESEVIEIAEIEG